MVELNESGKELISYIKDIFPLDAEVRERYDLDNLDYICCIDWYLNNDSNRPYKRSKIIKIIITRELLEVFISNKNKSTVLRKFKLYIENKYNTFEPDHNNSIF